MMQSILIVLLLPLILWGNPFDPAMLQIGAKIFPKVVLIEKGMKGRISSSVNIVIVANDASKESAIRLMNLIDRQYNKTLGEYPLNVNVVSPNEALRENDPHAYILLLSGKEALFPSLLAHAKKSKILTFCFDPDLLFEGVAVSLYIGRSVKPYLNLAVLRETPFLFDYGFLKLSQPYTAAE